MHRIIFTVVLAIGGAALFLASPPIAGQRASRFERDSVNGREVVAREVLVRFRQRPQASDIAQIRADADAEDVKSIGRAGALLLRSRSMRTAALLARLSHRPDVAYAEPNFIIHIDSEPNDPRFPELWALKNIGQVVGGSTGVAGADIHAVPAWNITLGSTSNVVAVIDTGIDYTHPDLAANMWSAPAAFTVNVGGGPITCAAGTHGFNAINRTCDPMDDQNHGTHVAGTIGATGDNGTGVVGINWTTRLMAIKFIDAAGSGTTADAIAAVEFAVAVKQQFAGTGDANIRVLSNSWGGSDFSQALLDEVNAANDADMLFVAGAGNDSFDNDILPFYPASFDAPNVVAVAATDNTDDLAWFSNYGASSVHLAAPGVDILSTTIGNHYEYLSGTSMATPHVSGAAALVLSRCALSTAELKETLLGTVDPMAGLGYITTSGGRLNVYSALNACIAPPETPTGLTARGLDTKVVLSWSAALGASRYNVKRSLTPGGPYSSIDSAVHGTSYTDTGVVNGTTYYYVVAAGNAQGESGDSNEASATPNIPPDVVVSSFTTPALAGSNATIAVSMTTKNQGAGTAGPSTTRLYFSDNSVLDASDDLLYTQVVPQLAPGALSSVSVSVVIPSVTTGTHYLIAKADVDDVLSESNETNNTVARSIQIGPDLTLSALTVPGNGAADSTIVVSDTTKNQGGGRASATVTRFYLSTNGVLDAGDTLLAGSRDVGVLDPGTFSSGATTVTIPASTAPGTYYIVAKADADGALVETSEANNTSSRIIAIGSDLVVSAFTVPAKGAAGSAITLSDTTTNSGAGTAAASVTRFYLSANNVLDASDTQLVAVHAVPDLPPGAADSKSTSVTLPAVVPGLYYLIAKADDDNVVLESKETNNTLSRSIAIGGDLLVTSFTVPAASGAGASMTVSDSTANQGGGSVGPTTTRFYLSSNNALDANDTLLGSRAIAALDAGAVSTGSTTVTMPSSLVPGSYYLIAKADADGVAAETQEGNNTTARSVQIGGNLVVSAITVPTKGAAGSAIAVSDTTTNSGGGLAPASVTRFYLSANSMLDASDTLLAGAHAVPDLAPGVADSQSTSVTLPAVAAGLYYLIAKADADNVVVESLESDNTQARLITIGSDLVVSVITAPAKGAAGSTVVVSDTTMNQGGADAPASVTAFYLATSSTPGPGDVLLDGSRGVPQLAPGASSAGSTSVTIPAGTAAGTFYLIAKADAGSVVNETVEANNTRSRSITIGPDLTISTFTLSASSVAAGAAVTLTDTVANQGADVAGPSTTRFYLSTNTVLDASDVLLSPGRDVVQLAGGASSLGSTSVTIPSTTAPGTYFLIAKTDADGVVAESAETNNVSAYRSIQVTSPQ
jgi:subtilisin family serine protease